MLVQKKLGSDHLKLPDIIISIAPDLSHCPSGSSYPVFWCVTTMCVCVCVLYRVFGTSMVEEYEEIADSQYPSERLEYLDEDYGKTFENSSDLCV